MSSLPWIRTEGDRFVDEDRDTILLRGVSLGGWMNMENFITGYPGAEHAMRAALVGGLVLGVLGQWSEKPLSRTVVNASQRLGVPSTRLRHRQSASASWGATGLGALT